MNPRHAPLGNRRWRQSSCSIIFLLPTVNGLFTGEIAMLETIAIILIILWLLGLVSSYTLGGFIHVLLVIAVVMIILRVIQGRSPV